jgi:formylglycine-generating enzyme
VNLRRVAAWVVVAVLAVAGILFASLYRGEEARCGPGFTVVGARCCPGGARAGRCSPGGCPPPLTLAHGVCDAPDVRVTIPETTVTVGPSDWEAEGRVPPRTLHVKAFAIDAFEATVGHLHTPREEPDDPARAASGVTRADAAAYCVSRGGRLPTDEEWTVAASAPQGHRYPWGETGAVCRRAAWGLAGGPCSTMGEGPDTVGAHPDGDSPLGLHDLAGNAAEWVAPDAAPPGLARGGSWRSSLAADLRTWARVEVDPESHDARIGVRCAYDLPR